MILNETMNEIADAIREKTGKTELIAPVNFAEEIKSISAGGGESGGSTDAIIIEPNGWYWGFSDEYVNSEGFDWANTVEAFRLTGLVAFESITQNITIEKTQRRDFHETLFYTLGNAAGISYVRYFAEAKFSTSEYNSLCEQIIAQEGATEEEFLQLMSSQFGLVRLTKEEYEALWNSAS